MSLAALLLAIGAMFSWGLTWVLMKAGVDRMDFVAFGLLRPWMGLPLIAVYAWIVGGVVFGPPQLVLLALVTGFLNAFLGTSLFYYALHHGTMHETNILANTNPLWGVVSAVVFLGEPASVSAFGAGVLVIGGTVFLVRVGDGARRSRSLTAIFAALGTGFMWGFSAAVPTKYCMNQGMSPIAFQLLFTASAALSWTLAALPRLRRGNLAFTRRGVWFAFLSSVFGMVIGWIFWLMALERARASALSPLVGLILLFATVLGIVFLKERLTRRMLIGGLLVLAGVTLVSVFP